MAMFVCVQEKKKRRRHLASELMVAPSNRSRCSVTSEVMALTLRTLSKVPIL